MRPRLEAAGDTEEDLKSERSSVAAVQTPAEVSYTNLFSKLTPLGGDGPDPAKFCSPIVVSDHDKGYIYFLFGVPNECESRLFGMATSTMEWEQTTVCLQTLPAIFIAHPMSLGRFAITPLMSFSSLYPHSHFVITQAWLFLDQRIIDHRRLLILGGKGASFATIDFFCVDLSTMIWSKFNIEGGTIKPRMSASSVAFQDRLFIFGGRLDIENLNTYSMAEFSPLNQTWMCKIKDRSLPEELGIASPSKLKVTPLYDGRKILLLRWRRKSKAGDVRNIHISQIHCSHLLIKLMQSL